MGSCSPELYVFVKMGGSVNLIRQEKEGKMDIGSATQYNSVHYIFVVGK